MEEKEKYFIQIGDDKTTLLAENKNDLNKLFGTLVNIISITVVNMTGNIADSNKRVKEITNFVAQISAESLKASVSMLSKEKERTGEA